MAGKYDPLGEHLRARADEGAWQVELSFGLVDRLVGGLPPSARRLRTWWANNSHGHALAWRDAGWHVQTVDLPAQRVVFVTGQVGGSFVDRRRGVGLAGPARPPRSRSAQQTAAQLLELDAVTVSVAFTWLDAGPAVLDAAGKPAFPPLPETPGLYRLTLIGRPGQSRPRVYIGETDRLRRRLAGNYRNPGASQQTSLRVNALLREHLAAGGKVHLAIATSATVTLASDDVWQRLDLSRKAGRLLAENAALVLAQASNGADIENLG